MAVGIVRADLVIAATLLGLVGGASGAGDLEREAAAAIAAHRLVAARNLYRTLAQQHPKRVAYQVWVGRLSGWLNDYPTANAAFDRALALDAANVEALVGKAYVAMWQEEFARADDLLMRAEDAAPENAEVQLALARNDHFQGRDRDAAGHVERVLAQDPGNREAQDLKRRLAPEPRRLGFFARLMRILTGRS